MVIAIVSGLLLFLPSRVLEYFDLCEFADKRRGTIALVFGAAILLLATYPAEWAFRSGASTIGGWRRRFKLKSVIANASADEVPVLIRYRDERRNTLLIPNHAVPTAEELVKKGLLRRATDQQRADGVFHSLTPDASSIIHSRKLFQKLLLKYSRKK